MRAGTALASVAAVAALTAAGTATAEPAADFHFDAVTPYATSADSPFAPLLLTDDYWLEDFEDGQLDTPGVTASSGMVRAPGTSTDSVDGDGSGIIDGSGADGYSYWTLPDGVAPSVTFTFDAEVLGGLPSIAGLVWTDGNELSMFTFEAFDAQGESLGTIFTALSDGVHNGSTLADRFLGVTHSGGISAISISGELGGIEIDHLQYGAVVPAPPVVALLAAGLPILARGRRRRR